MKRIFALVAVLCLLTFGALHGHAQTNPRNQAPPPSQDQNADDPDLPGFNLPRIDKADYLRRRAEIIKLRRGLKDFPVSGRGNPRADAVRELQRQRGLSSNNTNRLIDQGVNEVNALTSSMSWTEIGPAPIPNGQTTTISTPVSGRVVCIAVHPTNPDIVYVGTAQGGLYRSLDGGNSWTQLMDNAQSLAIGAVAISPSDPSTVWVGTGEGSFSCDSYFGVGLYRIDNADTLTPTLIGPLNKDASDNDVFTNRSIGKILVHSTDPNIIFVATTSGIGGIGCDVPATGPARGLYRSTNAASGAPTFAKLTVGTVSDISMPDMVFEPGNPNNLLLVVRGLSTENGGIYRTTNALAASPTFTRTLALGTTTARIRVALAITKVGTTVTVLAATGEAGTGVCSIYGQSGQLRRSTDGGQTWSGAISGANGFCGGQCGYDIAVAMNPTNTNQIYIGGAGNSTCSGVLKRSSDGSSFAASDTGLHADTHAIVVAPSNSAVIYTGNDGGVWRSNDGGSSWISLNKAGFNATQFQSLALHPTDQFFTIGGTQDNGTEWQMPDGRWTRADYGDGGFALIDQNAANTTNVTMYHTYWNAVGSGGLVGFGRVLNTANAHDDGWAFLGCGGTANGLSCNDSAVLFYAPMALGPGNPNTLYFSTDRLYRSTNQGTNMTAVSQQFVSGVAVSAIGIARQNDAVRIVGLENGKVYRTMTGSATLNDVTGAIPAKFVARAVIDPNDVNTAYVTLAGFGLAAGQHVLKTTNLNAATPTWVAAGAGIPDVPVNGFVVDPGNSSHLYAGTDIGVFHSSDGGQTWAPFGMGFPVVAVFDMAIHNPSRILRVATHGRGMWEIELGAVPPPTPPAAPSNLTATAASTSQINLNWTDNASNESGFKIERCEGAACTTFAQVAQVGAGATGYNDGGLAAGTTYRYRVRAYNAGGESSYSNEAQVTTQAQAQTPAAPSNLTATATSATQIGLSWTDNAGNETVFKIERCQGAGCTNFAQVATVGVNVTSFANTGLAKNTTYTYRVRANNAAGDSAYSTTASARTLRK